MFSVSSTVRISTLLNLDPPGSGLCVEDALNVGAEFLALGKHLIKLMLPEHGAQCRLSEHIRGRKVGLHPYYRAFRIHHVEVARNDMSLLLSKLERAAMTISVQGVGTPRPAENVQCARR
jgi:hypothetical protein